MSFFNKLGEKFKSIGKPKSESPSRPSTPPASNKARVATFDLSSDSSNSIPLPSPATKPTQLTEDDPTDTLSITQTAILYHEQEMFEAAFYFFSVGASRGDPLCLFLYGMALRHGLGTKRDEAKGLEYLKKAGEMAMRELKSASDSQAKAEQGTTAGPATLQRRAKERTALRRIAGEHLASAANELGQSYLQGWGVEVDSETAIYYFELAAELGDKDALVALGDMYYHGQGVKTDKGTAAGYYRLAEKQGGLKDMPSMSWIWKEKYDEPAKRVAHLAESLDKAKAEANSLGLPPDSPEPVGGRKWWH